MSVTEVARKYGYMTLERLHGDVLYSAGLSQQHHLASEWPTWVPDWIAPNHRGRHLWYSPAAELGRYKAAKDHEFSSRLAEDGDLIVQGSVVDRVNYVGTFDKWAQYSDAREA
jgi:hypothetical protein